MFLLLEKDNFFICFIHIFILFAIDTKSLNLPFILEAISLNLTLTLTITSFQMNQNRNESPLVSSSPSLFFSSVVFSSSPISCGTSSIKLITLLSSLSLSPRSRPSSLFFFQNITHRKRTTLAAQTIILFFYSCRWMDRDQPFHVLYRCTYSAPLPRLLDPPICFRSPGPPYFLFVSLRNPLHCMRPGSPGLFSGKGGGARESLLPAEIGKYL